MTSKPTRTGRAAGPAGCNSAGIDFGSSDIGCGSAGTGSGPADTRYVSGLSGIGSGFVPGCGPGTVVCNLAGNLPAVVGSSCQGN